LAAVGAGGGESAYSSGWSASTRAKLAHVISSCVITAELGHRLYFTTALELARKRRVASLSDSAVALPLWKG